MKFDTIIPAGGKYITADGVELTEENTFPSLQNNDVFVYEDYKYTYEDDIANGWRLEVIDPFKSNYSEVLESINNKPITSMRVLFAECCKLINAPNIPNTVFDMDFTFRNCESLSSVPRIPLNVTNMSNTFAGCTSLKSIRFENPNADIKDTFDKDAKLQVKGLSGKALEKAKNWYSNINFKIKSTLIDFMDSKERDNDHEIR